MTDDDWWTMVTDCDDENDDESDDESDDERWWKMMQDDPRWCKIMQDDDDDDNDYPMILNNRAKNHTSERTIVPWTVIF